MSWIKSTGAELLGLFVEDARLTAALAIWMVVVAASRPWWLTRPHLAAIALFIGFAAILAENVLHAARRS